MLSISTLYPWGRRPTWTPRIPEWFLASNVKTVEELKCTDLNIQFGADESDAHTDAQAKTQLDSGHKSSTLCCDQETSDHSHLSTTESEGQCTTVSEENIKRDECQYLIQQSIMQEIVDMTNMSLYQDSQSQAGFSKSPAILLRSPVLGCMHYMQSLVEYLAMEVGADLITFNYEDIADLSLDFNLQDRTNDQSDVSLEGLPTHYFDLDSGSRDKAQETRVRGSISAVINSAKRKKSMTSAGKRDKEGKSLQRATIIHIPKGYGMMDDSGGSDVLKSFREQVQERRQSKSPIILVITGFLDANIRYLNRALRQRLPQYSEHENLAPRSSWARDIVEHIPKRMSSSVVPQSVLERAAQQIAWKSVENLTSSLEMCQVLGRLFENQGKAKRWKDLDKRARNENLNSNSDSDSDSDTDDDKKNSKAQADDEESFEKRAKEVRRKYKDDSEINDLLSCVIHPGRINVTLEDVVMAQEVKVSMKRLLKLSKFHSNHISPKLLQEMQIKGALLYGPPGTGKTQLARALAKDMQMNFMSVTSATIESKFVGDSEKCIRSIFTVCSELSPCILFIDEVDSLFSKRKPDDRQWATSRTNQFLTEMDGISTSKDGPFVLVATNKPMELDEAFLRRLPHRIEFKLPTERQRHEILTIFLGGSDLAPDVSIDAISRVTKGFSGSDLRSLCVQAALFFSVEEQATSATVDTTEEPGLKLRHFQKALKNTFRSVSHQNTLEIEEFSKAFSSVDLGDVEERKVHPSIYERL
ncbi:ATPase family AAA domain-containing protein [Fusarium heterosporum]|uniref:ATPase family AAA domain-containing protein n=1 Tax=Fusarium heterosporum TaxID=42747 RepID=A0A8H5T7Y7_FUSHE|nr:ATPase family AAA domain-containing protein [Fusarium heterosporum]